MRFRSISFSLAGAIACAQLRFRLQARDEAGFGTSINDNLMAQEFSHTDSSPGYSSHSNAGFAVERQGQSSGTSARTDDFANVECDVEYAAH